MYWKKISFGSKKFYSEQFGAYLNLETNIKMTFFGLVKGSSTRTALFPGKRMIVGICLLFIQNQC